MASGALVVLDSLEKRGYELDQRGALTIMKFFARHELFEESRIRRRRGVREQGEKENDEAGPVALRSDPVTSRRSGEEAHLQGLPRARVREELSLLLLQWLSEDRLFSASVRETVAGIFSRLGHGIIREADTLYRLPLECCNLQNNDLCNICLAAADETVRGDGNSCR
ncbi:unnamed protein product [Trichogramma brassicae]|uniref:Uncharacterized protein n=1 Tax=Trichogramma brassicae TaxID=86971 RepID=A0A6H5I0U9_9HYME|nr:unnamed protein product [Trichogramma brassicae]